MTNRDQEILDSIAELIPRLTHIQKEKLLSFGEGMAFANDEKNYPFTEDEKKQQIGQRQPRRPIPPTGPCPPQG